MAGLPEGIGLRLITGEAREAILPTLYGWSDRKHVMVLQARENVPNGASACLVWGKMVSAESGVTNEQEQVISFKVRQPVMAELQCERLSRRSACLSITPINLRFSIAVSWVQARRINLVAVQGGRRTPAADRSGETAQFVTTISFRGPFPAASTFRIEIPPDRENSIPIANDW